MDNISVGSGEANRQLMSFRSRPEQELSKVEELNVTVSDGDGDYKVSAEAQYLFEMQFYFNKLDALEQNKAIEYFAKSDDPLNNKVADAFRKLQDFATGLREGRIKINNSDVLEDRVKELYDPNFVIDGTTEIGVRPNGIQIFRFDGKQNYYPATTSESNPVLVQQLEALEEASSGLLRNRDTANLFGSVRNMLGYSEHILFSADDVLHYNYALSQTQKTIKFVNPPEDLKVALNDLLSKGIAWQDEQQARAIFESRQLIGNPRVGDLAAENVRMGSAAQAFNRDLLDTFKSPHISLLNAGSPIKRMLIEQPDLVQFNPNRIDEALAFYRQDADVYEKALNRGFFEPAPEWKDPLTENDRKVFAASKSYAMKVIEEIQSYVVNIDR